MEHGKLNHLLFDDIRYNNIIQTETFSPQKKNTLLVNLHPFIHFEV